MWVDGLGVGEGMKGCGEIEMVGEVWDGRCIVKLEFVVVGNGE